MDTPEDYPLGPYAFLFPDMSDAEYAALEQSIREVGQQDLISVWRCQIVDGRHRHRACHAIGVPPKFEYLPDDIDVLQFVVGKNFIRRQLTTSGKAVGACKVYLMLTSKLPAAGEGSFAKLQSPPRLTLKQVAELFGVSPRSVAHAKAILAPDSTAVPALRDAVERGLVSVSDAASIVKAPEDIQTEALEQVTTGKSNTLRGAVRRMDRDTVRREAEPGSVKPLHPPALHQCKVGDLHTFVPAGSVDSIITHPPLNEDSLPLYADLADFAVHALKESGVMAVMVTGRFLPSIMDMLRRPGLLWVMEFDCPFDFPESLRHRSHRLTLSRRPILVYGKKGFQLSGGDDVIRLPSPDGPSIGGGALRGHDSAMALVVARFTQPGQVVCDPFLLGRGGTAVGALDKGCRFIGADPSGPAIEKTKKYLEKAGLGGGLEHGTSPTLF